MKKHSLLMLLPFALAITGCANLGKGSVFNEKFMKANFDKNVLTYEFSAPKKVDLALGDNISAIYPSDDYGKDMIFVRKSDGTSGFFSVIENKYVLPLDNYKDSGSAIKKANGFNLRFPYNYKDADGVKTSYLYDEYGNKIFEGVGFGISLSKKTIPYASGSDLANLITVFRYDSDADIRIPVAYAYYDLNAKLKEVITPEEYFKRNAYSIYEENANLSLYGHPELVVKTDSDTGGIRYTVYNNEKEKFVSSFAIPLGVTARQVGNYYYYQLEMSVHSREDNYDYLDGATKKIYETYRVNYLNGKEEKVNTKIIFSKSSFSYLVNEKGARAYYYLKKAVEVQKDKTLNTASPRSVILNDKFKEVGDVSGIDLSSLVPFGSKYWTVGNTVYDSKMREVGYLPGAVDPNSPRVISVNGGTGLVDCTGKFIIDPIYIGAEKLQFEDDIYVLYNAKEYKFVRIVNEKAVEIKTLSTDQYSLNGFTASYKHVVIIENETSKKLVLDMQDGSLADLVLPGDTDSSFNIAENVIRNGTLNYLGTVYKVGTAYFAITSETRINTSYVYAK